MFKFKIGFLPLYFTVKTEWAARTRNFGQENGFWDAQRKYSHFIDWINLACPLGCEKSEVGLNFSFRNTLDFTSI
jgi:hypothetical protein